VANQFIVEKTVPVLLLLFRESDNVNKRTALLDVLNGFLDATAEVYDGSDDVPVGLLKDDVFEVYSKAFLGSASEETTYKLTALDGFRKLLSLKGLLSDNEIGIVVQYFDDVILNDENDDTWYISLFLLTCSRQVLSALADLAKTKPQLILDITFPAFLAELPDSETSEKRDASIRQKKGYKTILSALSQISSERVIFEVLLRRLFSKLDILLSRTLATQFANVDSTSSITYPHAILGTIFLVIKNKAANHDADLPSYINSVVPTLLSKVIIPAAILGPKSTVLCSREVIHVVALIVNAVVRETDVSVQNQFYKELFKLYATGEPSALILSNHEEVAQRFRPMAPGADDRQAETVQIFASAVAAARKEVPSLTFLTQSGLSVANINGLLMTATEISTGARNGPRRQSLYKMIACITNKMQNDAELVKFIDSVIASQWTSKLENDRRKESLELLPWVPPQPI
jgi:DNA repair/transcription protein MET18/MMS19